MPCLTSDLPAHLSLSITPAYPKNARPLRQSTTQRFSASQNAEKEPIQKCTHLRNDVPKHLAFNHHISISTTYLVKPSRSRCDMPCLTSSEIPPSVHSRHLYLLPFFYCVFKNEAIGRAASRRTEAIVKELGSATLPNHVPQ